MSASREHSIFPAVRNIISTSLWLNLPYFGLSWPQTLIRVALAPGTDSTKSKDASLNLQFIIFEVQVKKYNDT